MSISSNNVEFSFHSTDNFLNFLCIANPYNFFLIILKLYYSESFNNYSPYLESNSVKYLFVYWSYS